MMVHNSDYTRSIFELLTLIRWMLWYMNYISIKLQKTITRCWYPAVMTRSTPLCIFCFCAYWKFCYINWVNSQFWSEIWLSWVDYHLFICVTDFTLKLVFAPSLFPTLVSLNLKKIPLAIILVQFRREETEISLFKE